MAFSTSGYRPEGPMQETAQGASPGTRGCRQTDEPWKGDATCPGPCRADGNWPVPPEPRIPSGAGSCGGPAGRKRALALSLLLVSVLLPAQDADLLVVEK